MVDSDNEQHQALGPIMYELGVAVYVCQQFENTLLYLVATLSAKAGAINSDTFKEGLESHSESTLGRLAKRFKEQLQIPDDFEIFIRDGVNARNLLVHGFVMRNTDKFLKKQGRIDIINELRETQYFVNDRLRALQKLLDRALNVFGGSLAELRQQANFRFEPDTIDEITRH